MPRSLLILLIPLLIVLTLSRNDRWQSDGSLWEDIIEKSPNKARAFNEFGLHLLAAGDPKKALSLLSRSLQLDPYQPQIYINLGLVFERLGQVKNALAAYDRAIYSRPDDPAAYYNLGVLYYRTLKDRDKALRYFLKARDLDPQEPDVHQYLAQIYAGMGRPELSRQEQALYEHLKP